MNRLIVTKPGFTATDAATTPVAELENFETWELAQLLAEAEYVSEDTRRQHASYRQAARAATADKKPGTAEWLNDLAAEKRAEYLAAQDAAVRIWRAYGRKIGGSD